MEGKMFTKANLVFLLAVPLLWTALWQIFPGKSLGHWLQYWWMFPIAFVIALAVNTVGISGAALFVPFFVLIFPLLASPLGPAQSVKLGLITEAFGLSSSAFAFISYGLVDKKLGLYTALGAASFVIAGSILAGYIPEFLFHFLIAGALLLSVYLLTHSERAKSKAECIKNDEIGHHVEGHENATLESMDGKTYKYCRTGYQKREIGYGIGGLFQGLAGFGIGELGIVSMLMTKIPIRVAIGTSHVVVALTAIIASASHISQSLLAGTGTPWNIVAMTVPAVIIGGQIAPFVSAKMETDTLEHFVAGLFVVLSIALLFLGISHL
ncbi:MAG: sulfite exporter TauE/SafE family protein [Candidatus Nanohaloarchaea archaeon]|nr:sulfite exporter TauE/SafE family protein [Candidatus Nanohaloarchaea archaeon]